MKWQIARKQQTTTPASGTDNLWKCIAVKAITLAIRRKSSLPDDFTQNSY